MSDYTALSLECPIREMQYIVNEFKQINHARLSTQTKEPGVLQGSILGSIIFLCHLRGLPSTLNK